MQAKPQARAVDGAADLSLGQGLRPRIRLMISLRRSRVTGIHDPIVDDPVAIISAMPDCFSISRPATRCC